MIRLFALTLCLFLLSSCGFGTQRVNQEMDSWIGRNQSDLLAKWGPPNTVFEDGDNKIYLYTELKTAYNPGTMVAIPVGTSGIYAAQNMGGYNYAYQTKRIFWVDKQGVITKTSWKGI